MKEFIFTVYKDKNKRGEEGLRLFGDDPDHYVPLKIINAFLGKKVLQFGCGGLMVHLWLPEKYVQLWSDKLGTQKK